MKIILIYTPRSGSTSILRYFSKLKPKYECIGEPWFGWMNQNVHHREYTYEDIVNKKNVFVKTTFKKLPVTLEQVIKDFDKVIFLLRRNMVEQVESSIYTHANKTFIDSSKKKYWLGDVEDSEFTDNIVRYTFLNETLSAAAIKYNKSLYYYEDLYYGSFKQLFKELNLKYHEKYFNEFLNKEKRYRDGTIVLKEASSLI